MSLIGCLGLCGSIFNDLISDLEEHLVDIAAGLCGGLEEFESVILGERLAPLRRNDAIRKVCFVCDEDFGDAAAGMSLNLLEPVLDIVKSGLLRAVVDQNDAHCALVVRLRDCPEPLLPRRVPHLQLHSLVLNINRLDLEVNSYSNMIDALIRMECLALYLLLLTDSRHVARREVVLGETEQDATLTH